MSTSNGVNCPNASNPYHQCTQACFQNTTKAGGGGGGTKPRAPKRAANNTNTSRGITTDAGEVVSKKEVVVIINNNGEKRAVAACPKASNPFHNCDDANCNNSAGSKIDHRKKKLVSKPESPLLNTVLPTKPVATINNLSNASSTKPHYYDNKNMEPNKDEIIPFSGELHNIPAVMPKAQVKDVVADDKETKKEEKVTSSSDDDEIVPITNSNETGSKDFSFSGTPLPLNNREILYNTSSEGETDSVISESRIQIGKYNVKESFGSILLSILDKYGDIGASCHLESIVMRSYYMECVCFVVQELQSCSDSISKTKVNELLDIVKDVESAHLQVAWLRIVLDKIAEKMQMESHHKDMEIEKANYDREVESLREQLQSELEILAQKEQEVADINIRIPEIRDRLSQLEQLKSSGLEDDQTMLPTIIKSKIDQLL